MPDRAVPWWALLVAWVIEGWDRTWRTVVLMGAVAGSVAVFVQAGDLASAVAGAVAARVAGQRRSSQ